MSTYAAILVLHQDLVLYGLGAGCLSQVLSSGLSYRAAHTQQLASSKGAGDRKREGMEDGNHGLL